VVARLRMMEQETAASQEQEHIGSRPALQRLAGRMAMFHVVVAAVVAGRNRRVVLGRKGSVRTERCLTEAVMSLEEVPEEVPLVEAEALAGLEVGPEVVRRILLADWGMVNRQC
jgi:hypothetical protein